MRNVDRNILFNLFGHRYVVLLPIGLICNGAVIFILLVSKEWRSRSCVVYLVQIALCNVLSITLRLTVNLWFDCCCVQFGSLFPFFNIYPVWLLVGLVTERTVAVIAPFKSRQYLSRKTAAIASLVIGLIVLMYTLLNSLMLGFSECSDADANNSGSRFSVFISIVYSFIPSCWIIVCNSIIIGKMKCCTDHVRRSNEPEVNHMTRMAIVLSIAFIVCTYPLSMLNILLQAGVFSDNPYDDNMNLLVAQIICISLSEFYSVSNLLLYLISSSRFRKDCMVLFKTL